jgi:putative ABC transport system permease protein
MLLATAAACSVLAASLASVPLFLSAAGTEAVEVQAGERCPRDTGVTYPIPQKPGSLLGAPDPFVPLDDELGPSVQWGRLETSLVGPDGARRTDVVVLYREGAFERLDLIAGAPIPGGVWVSDRLAGIAAIGEGDTPTLGGVPTPVAGVYRDLAAGTIPDPFWCAHRRDLLLEGADLVPPTPVVIADRETWFSLEGSAVSTRVDAAWEAPLGRDLTVAEAGVLVDELACDGERAADLAWCAGGVRPLVPSDAVPNATIDDRRIAAPDATTFVERYFDSSAPFVVERARAIQTAVSGGVWPVAVLAAVAGAGLVAAAALLWCERRRRDVALLTVRGVAPTAIGVKAVLELAIPLAVGCAAGVVIARGLVVWLGPSPALEPTAGGRAAWAGVVALLISIVIVTVTVTLRVPSTASWRRRSLVRLVPWEVLLAAAAVLSFRRLDVWGVPVSRGADVSRVDVVGLMFPVAFITAAVALAARVLGGAARPLRALSRRWPVPLFLAARRVARYRVAVGGIVAISAVASGVLAYSATVQRSMNATLRAKADTFVGSDVVIRLPEEEHLPAELVGRSTVVDRYSKAWVDVGQRASVVVVAVDPESFHRAAFWDPSMASTSLEEILERLDAPPTGDGIPALAVGIDVPRDTEVGVVTSGTARFAVAEVADVQAFPGMRRGTPAVFVAISALEDLGLSSHVQETWIRGDRGDIIDVLERTHTSYEERVTSSTVVDGVSSLTVTQTFGFMRSLGVAAGLLVVGGVAAYLDARRRSRVLPYALARRMGLTRRQHRRALLAEVMAGAGVGIWLGLIVAAVGAGVAHERLDPLPSYRPDPLLRPASGLILGLAVAPLLLAWIAAVIAQRAVDRDDPVEVLRGST